MCLFHFIGGASKHNPEELHDRLSTKASDLIKRSIEDIDPTRLIDQHTHIAGIGTGESNAFVNYRMRSWSHPFHRLKYKVYMSAAGVKSETDADQQLVDRLKNLVQNIPLHGKHRLLAFDKNYFPDGKENLEKTEFYVPPQLPISSKATSLRKL